MRSYFFTTIFLCVYGTMATASPLVGHKAQYELRLSSSGVSTEIVAINGKSAYSLSDNCDGWDSVEDYLMTFTYETGEELVLVSHFESWEQYGGALYSFDIREDSNFEEKQDFSGFAQSGLSALAQYSQSPDTQKSLPEDVIFPIHHTEEILKRAHDGETTYFAHVFFGAEPGRSLKKASAVIGRKLSSDISGQLNSDLLSEDVWPIQIAYFNDGDESGLPDYELSLKLQDNGVVQAYTVDYGDFALIAELKDIKTADDMACAK